MAKIKSKKVVETRNGYDIQEVLEELDKAGGGTTPMSSFRVMAKTGRIVKDRIVSLAEAQKIADQQPKG